ncbi:hypothetical protein OHA72_11980 [Dactylosporangium sp. NBC_01737]|uniref:hypothetical protein n=1 Tax=Dactylosporangium sp. NBC_01737 TaxID=2975959 RepID=UPI002E16774C|nr:hypothetical protein OHA72_11980 [Dactylosporangium sp. NBC_01737]
MSRISVGVAYVPVPATRICTPLMPGNSTFGRNRSSVNTWAARPPIINVPDGGATYRRVTRISAWSTVFSPTHSVEYSRRPGRSAPATVISQPRSRAPAGRPLSWIGAVQRTARWRTGRARTMRHSSSRAATSAPMSPAASPVPRVGSATVISPLGRRRHHEVLALTSIRRT